MATYKKRGAKKTLGPTNRSEQLKESKTAEVFDTLDVTANKTEQWVVKYQNIILIFIGTIAICVLSYLGYQNFVYIPKAREATSELNQAQYYFESQKGNSLFELGLGDLALSICGTSRPQEQKKVKSLFKKHKKSNIDFLKAFKQFMAYVQAAGDLSKGESIKDVPFFCKFFGYLPS